MEETLLDNIEVDTSSPINRPSGTRLHHNTIAISGEQSRPSPLGRYELGVHSTSTHHTQNSSRGVSNAIMMYSPYIPSVELRNGVDSDTDIGNYYSKIETEETVKCLVTSFLFCAVVVCIFLVAILKNPGM